MDFFGKNPFTPNFGQTPLVMAGRDMLISEITNAFDNAPGDPSLTSIFVGARGTGKTALLSLLANRAQSLGWIAVNVPCIAGMLEEIAQGAARAASNLLDVRDGAKLTGVSLGQVFGIEWEHAPEQQATWFIRMSDLLDRLQEQDVGLVITVDEVRPSLDEMIQLASFYQLFVREERKIALLMAGLPDAVSSLLDNESVSFLRRASRYQLDRIDDADVRFALEQTAGYAGREFEPSALEGAVEASGGFPFMVQLVGFRAWQASNGSDTIDDSAVSLGLDRARRDMETRVLKSSLDELSDGDLKFLEAMLVDEKMSFMSDVAERLGKSMGYASQYRHRLIERGIIGSRGRGKVGFDLPVLREYLPEYLELRW